MMSFLNSLPSQNVCSIFHFAKNIICLDCSIRNKAQQINENDKCSFIQSPSKKTRNISAKSPRKLVTRNSKSYQISISSVSFRSIFSHEPQFIGWWAYHFSKQTHQRTEFTKWMYPIAITIMFVFILAFAFVIPNNTLSYHATN